MGTLWNTYAFFVLYANIDGFDATKYKLEYDKLSVMDKWLLSKMNSMVDAVDQNLENYRIPEAARALQAFCDDMSNWYVRRGRERYWAPEMTQDKINAYMTLYTALVTVAKASAPMIPFMTEEIYRNLVCSLDSGAPISVHLCSFPEVNKELIDPELEYSMDQVLNVVVLGRAARNGSNIKNRQPLSELIVCSENALSEEFCDIIKEELNVKGVSFKESVDELVSYSFKPNLKTVGPKYGKLLNGIRTALSECDGSAMKSMLDSEGKITLSINGETAELVAEDLLIETKQKEGFFTLSDNGYTVTLNTSLTEELIEEGYVREIVSKLQTMRKEAGFDVTDHIKVTLFGNELLKSLFIKNADSVCADVLCDSYGFDVCSGYEKQWDINGEKVTLSVEKIG